LATSELVKNIDPTVPLGGLPLEAVESAVWDELETELFRNGESHIVKKKCARINGLLMHTMMSVEDTRTWINMFPKRTVYIPESTEEATERIKSGGRSRTIQIINLQGVPYSIPKGMPIEVPGPVANIVDEIAQPFRTLEMLASIGKPEYTPMVG
jgi:hypothetical protein